MRIYTETLRSHWKVLLIPVIIAAAIGGWFTFGAPKTYRSTATLWIDNGPAYGSALSPTVALEIASDPPATVVQTELSQVIQSSAFDLAVGNRSLLRQYLISTPRPKGFSPTVLLSHRSAAVSYDVAQSIGQNVTSSIEGPQVLSVSYTGPTQAVSRSVLASLLARLKSETRELGVDFLIAQERYYIRELTYQRKDAASLEQAAAAYLRSHPSATAQSDTIYAALLSNARASSAKLRAPTVAVTRTAALEAGGATPLIKVIDAPTLPGGPVRGLSFELAGVLAGAFAGVVLALLATLLLTPMPEGRWYQEAPRDRWDSGRKVPDWTWNELT